MKILLALSILLAGCAAPPASVRLSSSDEAPVAAVGPLVPFEAPELLLATVGPFAEDTEIAEVEIASAPGWSCSSPPALRAGAWLADWPEPPLDRTESLPVLATRDLGDGFAARLATLPAPVLVPAGEMISVGLALESSDACGVKAPGERGQSWHWREGRWTPVDGVLLVTAIGYQAD